MLKIIFALAVLVSQTGFSQALAKLKLCAVLPTTGPLAPFSQALVSGIKTGLKEAALKDPSLLTRVEFIVDDDGGIPEKTEIIAENLYSSRRCNILIGSLTSASSASLAAVASKLKLPAVLPTAADEDLTARSRFVFMARVDRVQTAAMLGRFTKTTLRKTSVATLFSSPDQKKVAEGFSRGIRGAGGSVVGDFSYSSLNTISLKAALSSAKNAGASAVFIPGLHRDVLAAIELEKSAQLGLVILGEETWNSQQFRSKAQGGPHYYLSHFHSGANSAAARSFRALYLRDHGSMPGAIAAIGYNTAHIILSAFTSAQSARSTALVRALSRLDGVQGASGPMRLEGQRLIAPLHGAVLGAGGDRYFGESR